MALKDFPILHARYQDIETQIKAIELEAASVRAEMDKVRAQIAPLEARLRDLHAQIKHIERPRLAPLKKELAAIAKGTGGKSLSAEPQ